MRKCVSPKANENPNLFIPSNLSKTSQCPKGNDYMQLKCKPCWVNDKKKNWMCHSIYRYRY